MSATVTKYFEPTRARVLAHRGLALDVPENTLLAFAKAIAIGAEYIETDVHLSADGIAVVAHDPTLDRVAERSVRVDQLTVTELHRVELGSGQGVSTLAEALDGFPETRFNIDVKSDAAVEAAVAAVQRTRAEQRVLLTSFSERRRRRLAALLPGVATSAGAGAIARARLAAASAPHRAFRSAMRGAHAAQVPEQMRGVRIVTPRFIEGAHRSGAEVHVWTVNDVATMIRLLDLGVDGIVTDRADLALPLVAARNRTAS